MHGEDMPMMGDINPSLGEPLALVDVGDIIELAGEFGSVLTSENVLWRLKASQRGLEGAPRGPSSPPTSFSTASVLM
jgi:hypothetical protein